MGARRKETKLQRTLYRIIVFLLVAIFLVSGFSVCKILYKYMKAKSVYNKTAEIAVKEDGIDFDALLKINPDVQGWLYQEDSVINYPVVQGTDNDKYLHTLIDGTWNGGGTLFVDCRNEKNFASFNTIIYGHHMKDGSMFHCLREYTKTEGYYDTHKTFDLTTPDGKYKLQVFSAYITPADSDAYKIEFEDESEKQEFIDNAFRESQLRIDVPVTTEDRIVTLSTCAYDFENARYVVLCKMIPED